MTTSPRRQLRGRGIWTAGVVLAASGLGGCSDPPTAIIDAAIVDGAVGDGNSGGDGGGPDAPTPDGGGIDGGGIDGGGIDGGAIDGGAIDGGAIDGGAIDGGAIDGGAIDGGANDAAVADGPDVDAAVDAAVDADPCPVALDALIPASLAITTDDNTKVWLNGVLIDDVPRVWSLPQRYDVMIYAHPRHPNLLAIEGINTQKIDGYDRGIAADLRFTVDGVAQTIVTDGASLATTALTAGWEQPGFDDSAWPAALAFAPVGTSPWGAVFSTIAPSTTAQWIWTYDPGIPAASKPAAETVYARRRFATVDARCAPIIVVD